MNILIIETKRAGGEWKPDPCWAFEKDNEGAVMAMQTLAEEVRKDRERNTDEPEVQFRICEYGFKSIAIASTEVPQC